MKKMMLLMLALFFLGAVSTNAQVTIGSDDAPHPGAILDLQSDVLGLKVPVVRLSDVLEFQLADDAYKVSGAGLVVFNSSTETLGGSGTGLYVWDGAKWNFAGVPSSSTAVPVSSISIDGANNVDSGASITLTADVQPGNAVNKTVSWSVIPSTGGTITLAGVFTGGAVGVAKVRATATDGSGVYGEKEITVNAVTTPVSTITISGPTTVENGKTITLSADVQPAGASNKDVNWSIYSGSGATVNSSGVVTGTAVGNVVVRATSVSTPAVYGSYDVAITATVVSGGTQLTGGVYVERTGNVTDAPFTNWVVGSGNLVVANANASGTYTWANAKNACTNGWRLPNAAELKFMYNNKATLEASPGFTAFTSSNNWSSTDYSSTYAWTVYFSNGYTASTLKTVSYYVRCVRSI